MTAKNYFDVKIPISAIYGMSISHGGILSTRGLEEHCRGPPASSVSEETQGLHSDYADFILSPALLLVIKKST